MSGFDRYGDLGTSCNIFQRTVRLSSLGLQGLQKGSSGLERKRKQGLGALSWFRVWGLVFRVLGLGAGYAVYRVY